MKLHELPDCRDNNAIDQNMTNTMATGVEIDFLTVRVFQSGK